MPTRRANQMSRRRRGQTMQRHGVIRQEWDSSSEGKNQSSKAQKAVKATKAAKP